MAIFAKSLSFCPDSMFRRATASVREAVELCRQPGGCVSDGVPVYRSADSKVALLSRMKSESNYFLLSY